MSRADELRYAAFEPSRLESVTALCELLGWPSYADASTAQRAFQASGSITRVALQGSQVVGLAHLLTNGVVHAHLSLVGVHPEHRRRGVARRLVTEAFRASGAKWLDLCAELGSEPFYRSFRHQEARGFRIHP